MKTAFDIGMYDGADSAYYLECGYRVIAVEANPDLVEYANRRFATAVESGRFTCVGCAISGNGDDVELAIAGGDLGSSSLVNEWVARRQAVGTIKVPGVTLNELFDRYGVPEYLKVDIEGADRLCVLALTPATRPQFLSFEVGDDVDELVTHAAEVGFTRFKIINQNSFRELANQARWRDRAALRLMRAMGYKEPCLIRRSGRFFVRGKSSGPGPWESDGRWWSAEATRRRLRDARAANALAGWYDIHATSG